MSLREALSHARLVTLGVLLGVAWLFLSVPRILNQIESVWTTSPVGQNAAAGVAGLLVIGSTLVLAVWLYSELVETSPAPDTWPPEA